MNFSNEQYGAKSPKLYSAIAPLAQLTRQNLYHYTMYVVQATIQEIVLPFYSFTVDDYLRI